MSQDDPRKRMQRLAPWAKLLQRSPMILVVVGVLLVVALSAGWLTPEQIPEVLEVLDRLEDIAPVISETP